LTSSTKDTARTLTFLVSIDDSVSPGGEKGLFTGRLEPTLQNVSVAHLRDSFEETLTGLAVLFAKLDNTPIGLPVKEVQVSFEVTATGKVALLGTGAEVAGKGAITITLGY
jgi:hypothetical protein